MLKHPRLNFKSKHFVTDFLSRISIVSTFTIQTSFVNKLITYTNRYNKTVTVLIENKVWTQLALSDLWKLFNFNEVVRKNVWLRSERVHTNMVVIQVLIALVITIVSVFPNRSSPNRFLNVHRNSTDVLPFLLFFPFKPQAAEQLHRANRAWQGTNGQPADRASLTAAAAGSVCTGPTREWEIYLTPIGVYWVAVKVSFVFLQSA